MPLEISEDLVSLAYQSLGYFVMEGIKVGVREIDLLAIRLGESGEVDHRVHVEVSISTRPIGVLRPEARLGKSASKPVESAKAWVKKKFEEESVVDAIRTTFRSKPYQRVFVYGRLKDTSQLDVLKNEGIECRQIGELIHTALSSKATNRLKYKIANRLERAAEIASLMENRSGTEGQGKGGS